MPANKEVSPPPDAPCDVCSKRRICAEKRLACRSFYQYAMSHRGNWNDKGERMPSRKIFDLCFPGKDWN